MVVDDKYSFDHLGSYFFPEKLRSFLVTIAKTYGNSLSTQISQFFWKCYSEAIAQSI
jgi:hypothetical protein